MNPAFNESDIERLKKDYIRNISINENVPQNIADREFRKLMYGDHPLGKEATQDDVAKYSKAEVEKFYKENMGALRAHIYISGNYDIKKAGESVKKYFSGWTKGSPAVKNIPALNSKKEMVVIERAGAPQSTISLGCPVVDISNPDYMKLTLMNTMLGGSFGSRITSNIREDKGYTYSPGSSVVSRYRTAFWVMEADVTTSATGPSLTEIYYEIRRLQNENPKESELEGIKNYSAGIFVLQNSTRQGVIAQLANLDLHELPASYLTDYVKNIYAVTPADISMAAKKYIDLKKMSLVVVGDKSVITEQLKAFDTDFPKN
jgi:predicted Zn-dependent peptidase